MFELFLSFSRSSIVTYTSSFQIKGRYSKNRIGVAIKKSQYTSEPPIVYSSRPPYDSGWMWTVEPDEDNYTLSRTPVMCGSIVTFSSPTTDFYLSTKSKNGHVYAAAATHKQEASDQWIVECRNGDVWNQDEEVMFQNLKHKCYLSSSLKNPIPEQKNKYVLECVEMSPNSVWKASEGVYFPPKVEEEPKEEEINEEL